MTTAHFTKTLYKITSFVLAKYNLDVAILHKNIIVQYSRNSKHGDYTTNLALQIGKKINVHPIELAGWIVDQLVQLDEMSTAEVVYPGFINLYITTFIQSKIIKDVFIKNDKYGCSTEISNQKINLEFVSANPTGPIHIGSARWAAVGDALGRLLITQGADVIREYYFNDHGAQINRFISSLIANAKGNPIPKNGYTGSYIKNVVNFIIKEIPSMDSLSGIDIYEIFHNFGVSIMFTQIKNLLKKFGTHFDIFTQEKSIYTLGRVNQIIDQLYKNGNIYEKDRAIWLHTKKFGDDKDRVLIKKDGNAAYITGDIAYYLDKYQRKFELCIYMLGADHHGYISRLKAGVSALGNKPNSIEILTGQMVNLLQNGKPIRMSKRLGNIATLDDIISSIGVDAARYALIRSSVSNSIDIDLALWSKNSSENPVYYVQYTHARIHTLSRSAIALGIVNDTSYLNLLTHYKESILIRNIGEFPSILKNAAALREPHHICHYLEQLSSDYNRFYDSCRILPQSNEHPDRLNLARIMLCEAVRQIIFNGLSILGVSAPKFM